MKAKNELRSVVKNNLWMLRKVWKHTPMYIICMIAEGVLWGINNSIDIIYMKVLLDSLGNGNSLRNVLSIVILYIAYRVVFYIFHHWYWDIFNPRAIERLYIALNEELFSHALSLDLAKYDDPEFYNEFVWSMKQTVDHAIGLVEDTGKLINRIVASVTLTGVLFSVDAGIATVIFAIAILQIIIRRLFNKIHLKFSEELNPPDRKLSYINRVYQLGDYAKEVRTTHVSDILLREFDNGIKEKKSEAGIRDICLGDEVVEELKIARTQYLMDSITYGQGFQNLGFVVRQEDGSPYKPDSITQKWERLLEQKSLPKIRLHDLRHSNATALIQAGVNPRVVQQRLGHSDVNITLNTYTHVLPEMDIEAAEKLDSIMLKKA